MPGFGLFRMRNWYCSCGAHLTIIKDKGTIFSQAKYNVWESSPEGFKLIQP